MITRFLIGLCCIGPFVCQGQCQHVLNNIDSTFQAGQYEFVLLLLKSAEKECGDAIDERLQKIKIDCLIQLDSPSKLIRDEVGNLLKINPQFDIKNNNNVSPDLANYIRTFNVYPQFKVGVSVGVPFLWVSRFSGEPVFRGQQESSYTFDRMRSAAYGGNVEYFPFRRVSIGIGYQFVNFDYQRDLQFDSVHAVQYTEHIRYHSVQSLLHIYPPLIKGFKVSIGYNVLFLVDAIGDIFATGSSFKNGIDQSTNRNKTIQNMMVGVGLDLFDFLDHRATVCLQARFSYGLTPINNFAKRYDDPDLSQDYYFTDDRFNLSAINLELSANYKIKYHIKPYR